VAGPTIQEQSLIFAWPQAFVNNLLEPRGSSNSIDTSISWDCWTSLWMEQVVKRFLRRISAICYCQWAKIPSRAFQFHAPGIKSLAKQMFKVHELWSIFRISSRATKLAMHRLHRKNELSIQKTARNGYACIIARLIDTSRPPNRYALDTRRQS
jgi:hypothetical protein